MRRPDLRMLAEMARRSGRPQSEILESFSNAEWVELLALQNLEADELAKLAKKNGKGGKGQGAPRGKAKPPRRRRRR